MASAMRAAFCTSAMCGLARFVMYPVGSSKSLICNESTTRPSFSISVPLASRTLEASLSRSRIISSTVRLPMIERR